VSSGNAAYASFEQKWLAAYPEQAAIAVFSAPADRLLASAFGCLVHEIEKTTFGSSEAQVAAVKLAWWRQELLGAAVGNPRHPISAVLFSDPRSGAVDASTWTALIDGAISLLEERAASTLDDLFDHYGALYIPLARLESGLFDGGSPQIAAMARLGIITHCLRVLPNLGDVDERLPLPLDLLARHGLTRSMLAQAGDSRTAALRDYLGQLDARARDALAQARAASVSRAARTRLDLLLIGKAIAASDPLDWLAQHPHASRWTDVWVAWTEARRLARAKSIR
jgi:15-cis-phytoene synthase